MEWYEAWAGHDAVVLNSQQLQLLAQDMHGVGGEPSIARCGGGGGPWGSTLSRIYPQFMAAWGSRAFFLRDVAVGTVLGFL